MKTDQIAYYAHDDEQILELKRKLNLEGRVWVADSVTGQLELFNQRGDKIYDGLSEAQLLFNYDNGIETDILTYTKGPHWHSHRYEFRVRMPFLSHIGIHMAPGEQSHLAGNAPLVQRMKTISHTNPYLLEQKRTYHYEIYDTTNDLGHYTKLIWRIQP